MPAVSLSVTFTGPPHCASASLPSPGARWVSRPGAGSRQESRALARGRGEQAHAGGRLGRAGKEEAFPARWGSGPGSGE